MNIIRQHRIKAVVLLTLSILGLFVVFGLGQYLSRWQDDKEVRPSRVVVSYCDVAATCSTRLQDAKVDLSIEPASMPVLRPLDMVVTLSGVKAERVTLEFAGRDMPMGLDAIPLTRNGHGADYERYTGTGSISFCSADREMVWLARINITTRTEVQTIVFELDTTRS